MKKHVFEARLSKYSRQAETDIDITRRGSRAGPAMAFAVAAAALAAPDTASAGIIYHAGTAADRFTLPPLCSLNCSKWLRKDLDGDGRIDLTFIGSFRGGGANKSVLGIRPSGGSASWAANGPRARTFGGPGGFPGQIVGPSAIFSPNVIIRNQFDATTLGATAWTAYLGFRFYPNLGSQVAYGWATVFVDGFDTNGLWNVTLLKFELHEWAYDDSGAPILAGQRESVTPEPGTLSQMTWIGLLALGAAGRAEMRRRKKAAKGGEQAGPRG